MLGQRRRQWARTGPALGQLLVFAGSVDRPHYVLHNAGCEDSKTVAQLIEPKDDLVTVNHFPGQQVLTQRGLRSSEPCRGRCC